MAAARARALAGLLGLALAAGACQQGGEAPDARGRSEPAPAPTFVGAARCAACHQKEADAYRSSDHARAMQAASPETVLGDFGAATVAHRGSATSFFKRDGKFFVRTEGPDGKPGEFEVTHTFGVTPLQQYLVPLAGGRLQALTTAWDARPRARGGQRWIPLYPDQRLAPPDPLHWTGREQTWNYQCADCHSTDLQKRYDLGADAYRTTWAEMTVSCEACHGPGSAHVAWAEAPKAATAARGAGEGAGLTVRLKRPAGTWAIKDPARGIAEWTGVAASAAEVEACARCHARRRAIVDPYPPGRPFLDTHVPALLDAGLYHADGQILGEVYEYGSFVQSRMFRAGVTCADCHEPHSGRPRAPGNQVCTQCHLAAKFDAPAHHHHVAESEAARCVTCHMPARTYMVVDPRRDHSFQVPRPDLSAALGTPNACTGCHRDRGAAWAADWVARWFGARSPARRPHYAPALDAARRGLPSAEAALSALALDTGQPGIARATAVGHLAEYLSPASLHAVESALRDADPLVRAAALGVIGALPPERRGPLAAAALRDPVRAVRIAAARAMAGALREALTAEQRADFDRALGELIASELVNAERPESHLNLGVLYAQLGDAAKAEGALRTALRLDPRFVPALVNLADLYRSQGREADGRRELERALQIEPENAEALHATGLLRVREGRRAEALGLLRRAAAARPESTRFAYVHAVALHDAGDGAGAIAALERAHARRPADRAVLMALAAYLRERGDPRALGYAEKLAAVSPADPEARALVEALRTPRPR